MVKMMLEIMMVNMRMILILMVVKMGMIIDNGSADDIK